MNWTAVKVAVFCTITALAALFLFISMLVPWLNNKDSNHPRYGTKQAVWRGTRCETPTAGDQSCQSFIQPSTTYCDTMRHRAWALQAMLLIAISMLILWCVSFAILHCCKVNATSKTLCIAFIATYVFIWIFVAIICIMLIATYKNDVCDGYAGSGQRLLDYGGQKLDTGFWLMIAAWIILTLGLCALCAWLILDPCAKKPAKSTRSEPSYYYSDDYTYESDPYDTYSRGQTETVTSVAPRAAPVQRRPSFAGVQFDLCGPKANDTGAPTNPADVAVDSMRASTMRY